MSLERQGVTYLLMASLPTAQMAMLRAARRLSVHQIRLLRPRFPDRKVETAVCPELDVPSGAIYWTESKLAKVKQIISFLA